MYSLLKFHRHCINRSRRLIKNFETPKKISNKYRIWINENISTNSTLVLITHWRKQDSDKMIVLCLYHFIFLEVQKAPSEFTNVKKRSKWKRQTFEWYRWIASGKTSSRRDYIVLFHCNQYDTYLFLNGHGFFENRCAFYKSSVLEAHDPDFKLSK